MSESTVQRKQLGAQAEAIALDYLQARGCRLIERNYRCRRGEIDLVVRDGATLVFVEVRSRRNHRYGTPAESVDARKQRKLLATAQYYVLTHPPAANAALRFDIVAVTTGEQPPRIDWIANAFSVFEG